MNNFPFYLAEMYVCKQNMFFCSLKIFPSENILSDLYKKWGHLFCLLCSLLFIFCCSLPCSFFFSSKKERKKKRKKKKKKKEREREREKRE